MFTVFAIVCLLFALILLYVWYQRLSHSLNFVLWLCGVMFGLGVAAIGVSIEIGWV